ncbi:MAG: ABC transporter permease [Bacteroidetes bacterium]|jgi:putative ABC transport system permease protein|nr:ABC transporter permease [Bacteroidota bacterium]
MMGIFNEIWQSIRQHKLRTAITGFSVAWGIFLLVVLLSVGNGLGNGVRNEFRDDAINSIWISPGTTSIPYRGLGINRTLHFTNDDYGHLRQQLMGYEYLCARFDNWGAQYVTYAGKSAGFSTRGATPDYRYVENTQIIAGRYINQTDVDEHRKVAVIGKPIQDFFFADEDPLGTYISVQGITYKVIGVFTDDGGDRENRMLHIPLTTAQIAYNQPNTIHRMMVTVPNGDHAASKVLEMAVTGLLSSRLLFDQKDLRALHVRNNFDEFKKFDDLITFLKYFVGFVGLMTLIAGVVGVGNILLITVKERTKEFGIRRAIGASPASVIGLILFESVFITFISGYLGLLAGMGLIGMVNAKFADMGFIKNPDVDLSIITAALATLVFTGALTGLLPAYRAVKVNPIEALRN